VESKHNVQQAINKLATLREQLNRTFDLLDPAYILQMLRTLRSAQDFLFAELQTNEANVQSLAGKPAEENLENRVCYNVERHSGHTLPKDDKPQPRTWKRTDITENLPNVVDVEGHGRWTLRTDFDGSPMHYDQPGRGERQFRDLLAMGDVTEVLEN